MDLIDAVGAAPAAYLRELVARVDAVLGEDRRGICLMGSGALGDYRPARSDLDVAAVCSRCVRRAARESLVAALEHEALPCPARGLEFVLYDDAGLAAPDGPAYLLNLNTGAGMIHHVSYDAGDDPRHWFVLDVAIARERARTLAGPPAGRLFPELPRARIVAALREALAWWWHEGDAPDQAVLAATRAWRWAAEGTWAAKGEAARWAAERLDDPQLVLGALARREGTGDGQADLAAAERFVKRVDGDLACLA